MNRVAFLLLILLLTYSTPFTFEPPKCLEWGMSLSDVKNITNAEFTLVSKLGSLNTYGSPPSDNFFLNVLSLESMHESFTFTDCDQNFIGLTVSFRDLSPDHITEFFKILEFKYAKIQKKSDHNFKIVDEIDSSSILINIYSDSTIAIINYRSKQLIEIEKDYDKNPLKVNDL